MRTKWLLFVSIVLLSVVNLLMIYTYDEQKMFILFYEGLPSFSNGSSNKEECHNIYKCSELVCKSNKPYYADFQPNCNVNIEDFIQRSKNQNSYNEYSNLIYVSKGLSIIEIVSLFSTLPMIILFDSFRNRITLYILIIYYFILNLTMTSITILCIYLEEIPINLPLFLFQSVLAVKILSTLISSCKFVVFIVNSYLLMTKSQEIDYNEDYFPHSMPRFAE